MNPVNIVFASYSQSRCLDSYTKQFTALSSPAERFQIGELLEAPHVTVSVNCTFDLRTETRLCALATVQLQSRFPFYTWTTQQGAICSNMTLYWSNEACKTYFGTHERWLGFHGCKHWDTPVHAHKELVQGKQHIQMRMSSWLAFLRPLSFSSSLWYLAVLCGSCIRLRILVCSSSRRRFWSVVCKDVAICSMCTQSRNIIFSSASCNPYTSNMQLGT